MWIVIKFEKRGINLFKHEIKKKFGENFKLYSPQLTMQNFKRNKLKEKKIYLLGDYAFCYHTKFSDENFLRQLNFTKGVKYFLNGFKESQREICNFIKNLKGLENENGYITHSIYKTEVNKIYKFASGPFTQKIFKIINLNKEKIDVLIGNLKTRINRKEFLFKPV